MEGIIVISIIIMGLTLFFMWAGSTYNDSKNQNKDPIANLVDLKRMEFIKECKANGIKVTNNFDEMPLADKEKMKLIAKKHGWDGTEKLSIFYSNAKDRHDRVKKEKSNEKKQKELNKIKEKERKRLIWLTKFSQLEGRQKRISMAKYQMEELKDFYDFFSSSKTLIINKLMEKESDGTIRAGAMMAIGGTLGGIDSMINTQKENEELRRNKERLKPKYKVCLEKEDESNILYIKYKNIYEKSKVALVSKTPTEEVFKRLYLDVVNVHISETGAFDISVYVSLNESFKIFDDVDAVVDGTIAADLYQNNKFVGRALLVLPLSGIGKDYNTGAYDPHGMNLASHFIRGINIDGNAQPDYPWDVKFAPLHLWEIEKIKGNVNDFEKIEKLRNELVFNCSYYNV